MSPDDATALLDLDLVTTPLHGKIPTLKAWTTQPKPSREFVMQWAAAGNLGVRTGRVSGVVVIDAEQAAESDEAAKIILLKLPPTWTVQTGGGGRHYYYRLPDGLTLGNSVGKLAPHIDVRAEGGQVVAPGSVHPKTGALYEWADGLGPTALPIATLPGWVVEALDAKPAPKPRGAAGSPRATAYAAAAIKAECGLVAAAPEGARNDTLNRAAFKLGTLVGAGELDEADVVASLSAVTGLGDREAMLTIRSGLRAGKAKPRRVPTRATATPRGKPPTTLTAGVRAAIDADPHRTAFTSWHDLGLTLNHNGGPYQNVANAAKVIETHPATAGKLWYDTFYRRIFTTWMGAARKWSPRDDLELTIWLSEAVGFHKIAVGTVRDAIEAVGRRVEKSEPVDWLNTLAWDHTDRLDGLFIRGFGSEDTLLVRRIGLCWLTSLVARLYRPGCKVDTMPVLEGSQGTFKTRAMSIIGGPWYGECHESIVSKDFYLTMFGKALLEIAELESISRAEADRIKGIISCPTDTFRAPYERLSEDHPRQCVFAGTTNRNDWQRDETGGRRFWPVRCGRIDPDWIGENRDQLFAEAVWRFKAGMDWWEVPKTEAMEAQAGRRPEDTWTPAIADWIAVHRHGAEHVIMGDVLTEAVGLARSQHDFIAMKRVASALRYIGFESRVRRVSGVNTRVWVKI